MLQTQVAATIDRHRMLAPGQTVLVAVSGGPDSLALLAVMRQLAPALQLRLAVAHLDHGLRPDSAADAEFVAALAQAAGLPCYRER
ncbi:MAG: ATP-binding protein, partial [Chloroflexota bacterium]